MKDSFATSMTRLSIRPGILQHDSHGCHGEEQHEVLDRRKVACWLPRTWRPHSEGVWVDVVILTVKACGATWSSSQ